VWVLMLTSFSGGENHRSRAGGARQAGGGSSAAGS
jgi:hypothetical protein